MHLAPLLKANAAREHYYQSLTVHLIVQLPQLLKQKKMYNKKKTNGSRINTIDPSPITRTTAAAETTN